MKEFLASNLPAALTAIAGLLASLFAAAAFVVTREWKRRAAQATTDASMKTLRGLAMDAVRAIEQRQVVGLKDPTKGGEWNSEAQQSAFANALVILQASGRPTINALVEAGMRETDVKALCTALIESAVLELRTKHIPGEKDAGVPAPASTPPSTPA